MNCLLKKFLLKNLNKFLDNYKDDVETSRKNVKVWLKRAETITKFLNMLSSQLEDGNISEDELKATIEGLKNIVQDW
jgi:DNA-binding transcriptional regulator WhiA